jgi:hypothetical protein
MAEVLASWGPCPGCCADIFPVGSPDGIVGAGDLAELLARWGLCPGCGSNDCCVPSPDKTPGCDNAACCDSVCAIDPFCCDSTWDSVCADEALVVPICMCGVCETSANDCCAPSPDGTPGCNNSACCESVCAIDPFCCETTWDGICADATQTNPFCMCPATCFTSANDCCAESPDGTPGCNQLLCCQSLCEDDPFCCDTFWDGFCAAEAAQIIPFCVCPAICGTSANDCCVASPNGTPGCNQPACCESVCAIDPFCCDTAWDAICAGEAEADSSCACPAVCGTSINDCCVESPNGTPGCNQLPCCESVREADPFCCEVVWDSICAGEAQADFQCACGG